MIKFFNVMSGLLQENLIIRVYPKNLKRQFLIPKDGINLNFTLMFFTKIQVNIFLFNFIINKDLFYFNNCKLN